MSRDPTRTRKLTTTQEHLIRAHTHLSDIDLRRCSADQRAHVKAAREHLAAASTAVDKAIQTDVPEPV
jgi:hypothetical protein